MIISNDSAISKCLLASNKLLYYENIQQDLTVQSIYIYILSKSLVSDSLNLTVIIKTHEVLFFAEKKCEELWHCKSSSHNYGMKSRLLNFLLTNYMYQLLNNQTKKFIFRPSECSRIDSNIRVTWLLTLIMSHSVYIH